MLRIQMTHKKLPKSIWEGGPYKTVSLKKDHLVVDGKTIACYDQTYGPGFWRNISIDHGYGEKACFTDIKIIHPK